MELPWWLTLDDDIFKRLQKLLCAAYLTCKDIDSGDEAYVWPDEDVRELVVKAYTAIQKHNRQLSGLFREKSEKSQSFQRKVREKSEKSQSFQRKVREKSEKDHG